MRPRANAILVCILLVVPFLAACQATPGSVRDPAPVSGTYAFWPTFPDDPHVQFVRAISTSTDVDQKKASGLEKLVFGKEADNSATINKPYGVAMRDGKIYVADIRNNCVVILDLRKKQTRLIGTGGVNQLKTPVAVAVAEDSTLYVADVGRGAILVYENERYSRAYGHPNFKPAALAIHKDRLYATDMTAQRVEIFDRSDGRSLGTIGTVGDEDGQFRLPLGVATDKAGDVYVMDMMRCRLQKFAPDGRFIGAVGAVGKTPGTFVRPKHLAVDGEGTVYVIDAAFQNVQMFDDKFEILMHFGAVGNYPGALNLPAGLCVSEDPRDLEFFKDRVHPGFNAKRLIVVSNQFGDDKLCVYVGGGLREGHTAQELAKVAAPVTPGTGKATPEEIKMSAPGTQEPALPETGSPKPANSLKEPDKSTEPK